MTRDDIMKNKTQNLSGVIIFIDSLKNYIFSFQLKKKWAKWGGIFYESSCKNSLKPFLRSLDHFFL
jgi:hypothetical protein